MNKIIYQNDDRIYAATTMRDITCPEANNMALHVCNDPEAILQNRKQLEKETISLNHWALPWQKHTNKSYRITQADWSRGAYTKREFDHGCGCCLYDRTTNVDWCFYS